MKKIVLALLALSVTACKIAEADPEDGGNKDDLAINVTDTSWVSSPQTYILLADNASSFTGEGVSISGNKVTISAAGTYAVSGTLTNGQLVVSPGSGEVKIALNGVNIKNSDTAPVFIKSGDRVILHLSHGSVNEVTDGPSYTYEDAANEEPDAAVFSKVNLVFSGSGALRVTGNHGDAIASKDGLIINGGKFTVSAADDAIRGKDFLVIHNGEFSITSAGDGLKSSEDGDDTRGYVRIENGSFAISAGDDAVHAETSLTINGGTINITKSYEGLEGKTVTINGGNISLVSSDDGINAAYGTSSGMGGMPGQQSASDNNNVYIKITGGTVVVNASGDGVDSNGSIFMTGGILLVHGPVSSNNGALDYDATFKISGGLFVAVGSSGMAQTAGTGSIQNALLLNFSSSQSAGKLVNITGSSGTSLLTFKPLKAYQSIAFSSPELVNGSYTLSLGGTATGTEAGGLYTDGTYSGGTPYTTFNVSSVVTRINAR